MYLYVGNLDSNYKFITSVTLKASYLPIPTWNKSYKTQLDPSAPSFGSTLIL